MIYLEFALNAALIADIVLDADDDDDDDDDDSTIIYDIFLYSYYIIL
jgi:hypothetical protein